MRPHLSLDVRHVPQSVAFYEKVFGVPPQKQTADYAKFDLAEPALNFSLVSATGKISSVDHLGIEVESIDEIATWKQRLQSLGILEKVEENIACCFARRDRAACLYRLLRAEGEWSVGASDMRGIKMNDSGETEEGPSWRRQ
ncbi:MAG: uncharacterized protein K0S58_803 [Nitrospira sp.]|nr:uncharacterized protein [Nitrospira sp.]